MGRTRRLTIIGLASVAAASGLMLGPSSTRASVATPSGDNWYIVTISAGPAGADVVTELSASGTTLGQKPDLVGFGIAVRGRFHFVSVLDQNDSGETSISTTRGLGSQHIVLHSPPNGMLSMTSLSFGHLGSGQTVTFLAFFTDAVFGPPRFEYAALAGSAVATLGHGGGSEAVVVGARNDAGLAAQAAGYGGGALTHTLDATTGLVGAFSFVPPPAAQVASATWASPDGRHGNFVTTPVVTSGAADFAGPAGAWVWKWTGFTAGTASFAAYAPAGDAWRSFA